MRSTRRTRAFLPILMVLSLTAASCGEDGSPTTTTPPPAVVNGWAATAGGTGADESRAVYVDANGNIFVAGYFQGTASFDGQMLTSDGDNDAFLASYDADGNVRFIQRAGGSQSDLYNAIVTDMTGAVFTAGSEGSGMRVGFYEQSGTLRWERFYGGGGYRGYGVAVDDDGNIIVAGHGTAGFRNIYLVKIDRDGNTIWTRTDGVINTNDRAWDIATVGTDIFIAGARGNNIYIARYDGDGNVTWSRTYGAGSVDEATRIAVANGRIAITGYFRSTTDIGGSDLESVGFDDVFVGVYTTDGDHVWSTSFGSTTNDVGAGVAFRSDGNVLVSGQFRTTMTIEGTDLLSAGATDAFVAEFGAGGGLVWARRAGGTLDDYGYDVAPTGENGVIVTGWFSDNADFDGDPARGTSAEADIFLWLTGANVEP